MVTVEFRQKATYLNNTYSDVQRLEDLAVSQEIPVTLRDIFRDLKSEAPDHDYLEAMFLPDSGCYRPDGNFYTNYYGKNYFKESPKKFITIQCDGSELLLHLMSNLNNQHHDIKVRVAPDQLPVLQALAQRYNRLSF